MEVIINEIKNSDTGIVHIIKDSDFTFCGMSHTAMITYDKTKEMLSCKRCLRWLEYGAKAFISKPFTQEELIKELKNLTKANIHL